MRVNSAHNGIAMAKVAGTAFPQVLAGCRTGVGLSQASLATQLGIPVPSVVAQYEAGTHRFPIEKLTLLAEATGAPSVELIKAWLDTYAPDVSKVLFPPASSLT